MLQLSEVLLSGFHLTCCNVLSDKHTDQTSFLEAKCLPLDDSNGFSGFRDKLIGCTIGYACSVSNDNIISTRALRIWSVLEGPFLRRTSYLVVRCDVAIGSPQVKYLAILALFTELEEPVRHQRTNYE